MSIIQMSFSASILILVIIVIRALAINKLPKKAFLAFWAIALLRLLIPFSFPSPFSVYSFISNNITVAETMTGTPAANIFPIIEIVQTPSDGIATASVSVKPITPSLSFWGVIWIVGVLLCVLYFVIAYIRCYKRFQTSAIVHNEFITNWLAEHKIIRPISIRQSSQTLSPLTYGVFRPVILVPLRMDWSDEKALQYVLAHEYEHIRRFDTVTKLLLTAALCIHWFNPLVWAMYILSNRDIEMSCDEAVVRSFGDVIKSSYARVLVSMEERKSSFAPYYNSFSKNAIEERIIAIMKIKKTSLIAGLFAVLLISGVTTVFATSAANANPNFSNFNYFPNNISNTEARDNSVSEIKVGDNFRKDDGNESVSYSKKISFDIDSIKLGENVQLGGYALQKGDTVQIDFESSDNNVSVYIFLKNENATSQPIRTKILNGTAHEISQAGDYYFSIQSDSSNGVINNIKGTIQLSYLTPQKVQDERIQFTDDEINPNENHSTGNVVAPTSTGNEDIATQQATSNVGTSKKVTIDSIKSPYDGMFDDNTTVLNYFNENKYTADNYQENVDSMKATLVFTKFAGSKVVYDLNFEQATTVDFSISADVDGEYKIAFITENNEVIMKASSYNGFPASKPIDVPKGKIAIVLIGEQATGNCTITLDY